MTKHPVKTYYPNYDVLEQKKEWDPTTQSVIDHRLNEVNTSFFSPDERKLLQTFIELVFPSHLGDVTINVIAILDQRFATKKISGYAKGTNKLKVDIIRKGMKNVESHMYSKHQTTLFELDKKVQQEYIHSLKENQGYLNVWQDVPPALFFKTLTEVIIPIIYSDPAIWSKIGYGGPAFPRGYYAMGPNQFDQWEAEIHE
jgi:hypothetical protein